MAAIDTIASYQGTSGSTLAAGTLAAGDSATIKSMPGGAVGRTLAVMYDDVTSAQAFRIRSPYFHDNIRGMEFTPAVTTPPMLIPPQVGQPLRSNDTLAFELSTAASTGKALAALSVFYPQLDGIAANLRMASEVTPNIVNIKPHYVAVGSGANTAGAWWDLVFDTTENVLKAGTKYAVLGLLFDQAVAALAIKGADTGNLRISAPGGTSPLHGPDYFLWLSDQTGLPTVPVINATNVKNTYISIISSAATGAAGTFQVVLGELPAGF
jgi:hypothetical protein